MQFFNPVYILLISGCNRIFTGIVCIPNFRNQSLKYGLNWEKEALNRLNINVVCGADRNQAAPPPPPPALSTYGDPCLLCLLIEQCHADMVARPLLGRWKQPSLVSAGRFSVSACVDCCCKSVGLNICQIKNWLPRRVMN